MMYLALSYDHRIIDGREAVTFLVRVKECIEDPERCVLLLDAVEAGHDRQRTTSSSSAAGPGGYVAAIRAAQLGLKVACVEKRAHPRRHLPQCRLHPVQGAAAILARNTTRRATPCRPRHHGRRGRARPAAMMARKDKVVGANTRGVEFLFKKNKVDYSRARRASPRPAASRCDRRRHRARADGKRSSSPPAREVVPLPGVEIDEKTIVSSTGALALPAVPKHLVVVGGGVYRPRDGLGVAPARRAGDGGGVPRPHHAGHGWRARAQCCSAC